MPIHLTKNKPLVAFTPAYIAKNNEIIARYMNLETDWHPFKQNVKTFLQDGYWLISTRLNYHKSFDRLMPVAKKAYDEMSHSLIWKNTMEEALSSFDIAVLYEATIKTIEKINWYNSLTNK